MSKTKESTLVTVVDNQDLGGERFRLSVKASAIHQTCQPGQFFNIALIDERPYLPRPFSIYEIHRETNRLDFLIAAVGQGTRKMQKLGPGDEVLLIGPLGRGFPLSPKAPHHVFVAGSIGLAPFIEFHKELKRSNPHSPHTLIYGARNKAELVDCEFLESFDWDLKTCTDDGSAGHHGWVTDILKEQNFPTHTQYYTCGPTPMMQAVAKIIFSKGEDLWVSMEEAMACGIGICKGCVIYSQNTPPPLTTICKNGPVFKGSQLFGS